MRGRAPRSPQPAAPGEVWGSLGRAWGAPAHKCGLTSGLGPDRTRRPGSRTNMWKRSLCGGHPRHQPGRPHSAGGCRSASATTAPPEPLPPAAAKSGWSPFCPLWLPCAQVGGGRQVRPSSQAWAGGEPPDYQPQGGQGWGEEGAEPRALPTSQPGPVTALLQAPWSPGSAGTHSSARTSWTPYSPTSMQGLPRPAHAVSPLLPTPQLSQGSRAGTRHARLEGGQVRDSCGHSPRDQRDGHSLQEVLV